MNPVHEMFNDLANQMRITENNEEYISNTVQLKGASGKLHELSYDQAKLFLGVLSGEHPFLYDYNPLEFLLFSYQFQDKIKLNYLAVQFQIIYDNDDDTIFVSGVTKHPMTVVGHSQYVEGASIPVETFQVTIPNVGLYGSLALVNCIAAQHPDFNKIRGSFGGSFIYVFENGVQSIKRYEPKEIDEAPTPDETKDVILEAMKKLRLDRSKVDWDKVTPNSQSLTVERNAPGSIALTEEIIDPTTFTASGIYA